MPLGLTLRARARPSMRGRGSPASGSSANQMMRPRAVRGNTERGSGTAAAALQARLSDPNEDDEGPCQLGRGLVYFMVSGRGMGQNF